MWECAECNKKLEGEIFIGDDGDGVYCDSSCYLEWYQEHCDYGYYTTVKDYKKWIEELEKRHSS